MLYFNFCLFPFSKFDMTIVKNIVKDGFRLLLGSSYVVNIFDIHIFDKDTEAFLNFFEIFTEMHFVSLLFLNEKNIIASLLMIFSFFSTRPLSKN